MHRALNAAAIGSSPGTSSVFCSLFFLLFAGMVLPYTRTILSNSVPAELQAKAFSAFSATEGVSSLLAPVFGVVYAILVTQQIPRLLWFLLSLFFIGSFFIISYVKSSPSIYMNLPAGNRAEVAAALLEEASDDRIDVTLPLLVDSDGDTPL